MRIIGSTEALEMLRTVVKDREDFVYPLDWKEKFSEHNGCVYFADSVPRCIIGNALSQWGYDVKYENDRAGALNRFVDGDVQFTDRALDIFEAAQHQQDTGRAWSKALAAAEERAVDSTLGEDVHDHPIKRRFNW